MSNITLSFEKDGSDRLTHNVPWGRKGTQNGIVRILGYQALFLGRLPGDHFTTYTGEETFLSPPSAVHKNGTSAKDILCIFIDILLKVFV